MRKNIIIVILSLLLVIVTMVTVKEYKLLNKKDNKEEAKKIEKIYSDKDYVFDGTKYKPKYANDGDYAYVPFINLDSEYVRSLNDYLSSDTFANPDENYMSCEYEWHLNGNILSVVVRKRVQATEGRFDFWKNIDITTGEEVELTDVLKLKKMSINDFYRKVNNVLTNYANECYSVDNFKGGYTRLEDGSLVENSFTKDEFIKKSIKDVPTINDIPFYLNENDNIRFVANLIACGGSGVMWTFELDLEEK